MLDAAHGEAVGPAIFEKRLYVRYSKAHIACVGTSRRRGGGPGIAALADTRQGSCRTLAVARSRYAKTIA